VNPRVPGFRSKNLETSRDDQSLIASQSVRLTPLAVDRLPLFMGNLEQYLRAEGTKVPRMVSRRRLASRPGASCGRLSGGKNSRFNNLAEWWASGVGRRYRTTSHPVGLNFAPFGSFLNVELTMRGLPPSSTEVTTVM